MLAFRVRYTGVNNVPKEGPVLLVANHQSSRSAPDRRRSPNDELAGPGAAFSDSPCLADCSYNAIPLDVEGNALGSKKPFAGLSTGKWSGLPEGARTPDGEAAPFMPGFTTLAIRSASILPVAMEGAFHAWPRTRRFPRLTPIHVHFGVPLLPTR